MIFKHIDILGSFGGTIDDIRASLDLIAKGVITPQVETTSMDNFPQVVRDLHEGKIRSRMVLIPEGL